MELTTEENNLIGQLCLEGSENGELKKGVVMAVATRFQISRGTVYRLWNLAKEQRKAGLPISLASKKIGCTRSTKKMLDAELYKTIPLNKRRTMRGTGKALGVSKDMICRWKKEGVIKSHTNAIKPRLTDSHKITRLKYCLNALRFDNGLQTFIFKSMSNVIHMDEKWFDMSNETTKFYMLPSEVDPYKACQSKAHIPKIMFNCAVTRPLYSDSGEVIFDGKIGIWPFTRQEPAQRNSKNRIAGTLVTKPVGAVTKDVTRDMIITKVIPAIHEKWPINLDKRITIQWDNARPHISNDDPLFREAASSNGFDINLVFQPANSPDTNINDLSWFRSIDSLKADFAPNTLDELIEEVNNSFSELSHYKLNKVFLSLQGCMIETMKVRGGNNYQIKHQRKDALFRQGVLPENLHVDMNLVKDCINYLKEKGQTEGLEALMTELNM